MATTRRRARIRRGLLYRAGYNSRMTRCFPAALVVVLAISTVTCGRTEEPTRPAAAPTQERDIHTFARPDEARVTHVALDLRADFDAKVLAGRATLSLQRAAGANQVVLDTSKLTIERVTAPDGSPLKFTLGDTDAILGRALTIELPPNVTDIVVTYRTSPDADALQWLTP